MKLKAGELAVIAGIALFMVLVQVIALLLVPPLTSYNVQAFGDPQSVWNPIYYIILLLVLTGFLLLVIKYNVRWIVQAIMGVAILSTLGYVIFGLVVLAVPSVGASNDLTLAAEVASAVASVLLTALLLLYPEWFIIDTIGVLVAAGAAALFGISLAIIPTLILLILLAIYDYISVYKTKHMIRLAEGVMDLKMPIMFVMPRRAGYSFLRAKGLPKEGGEREAYFMGLGDAIMPTMLAVSANAFLPNLPRLLGFVNVPALGSLVGTLVSYFVLMYIVVELKKPQAGLPFLCTGSIVGFLLGCIAIGVNPF